MRESWISCAGRIPAENRVPRKSNGRSAANGIRPISCNSFILRIADDNTRAGNKSCQFATCGNRRDLEPSRTALKLYWNAGSQNLLHYPIEVRFYLSGGQGHGSVLLCGTGVGTSMIVTCSLAVTFAGWESRR